MSELCPQISKIFQPDFSFIKSNKDMIRIIIEVIVFIGICYYFNSKNTKTLKHIEDLSQRIEEQEDENEKMKNTIAELTKIVNTPKPKPTPVKVQFENNFKPTPVKHTPIESISVKPVPELLIEEVIDEVIEYDLDNELKIELDDLIEPIKSSHDLD